MKKHNHKSQKWRINTLLNILDIYLNKEFFFDKNSFGWKRIGKPFQKIK